MAQAKAAADNTGTYSFLQLDPFNILVAQNLIVDLIRILALQKQSNACTVLSQNDHANHPANLLSIGSSVCKDIFDIKLAVALIEQALHYGSEEKTQSAVSNLAARARLLLSSPTLSTKVASDEQYSASRQPTRPSLSICPDEPDF